VAAGPDILASRQGAGIEDGDAATTGTPPDGDVSRPLTRDGVSGQVLIELFDKNPQAAADRFLHLAADKTAAAAVLKSLSEAARPDVVLSITDAIPFNERTAEGIVIERSRALGQMQSPDAAAAFLDPIARARKPEAGFNYSAGRMFAELRAYDLAIPYLEAALSQKSTPAAADRLFMAYLLLGRYSEAGGALLRLLTVGGFREGLQREFAALLVKARPGELDAAVISELVRQYASHNAIGVALIPHLVTAKRVADATLVVESQAGRFSEWDEATIVSLMAFFRENDRPDVLFAMGRECSGVSPTIAQSYIDAFSGLSAAAIRKMFLEPEAGRSGTAIGSIVACVALAERLAELSDFDGALEVLGHLGKSATGAPEPFYARNKARIARLVSAIASRTAKDVGARRKLAAFVLFWLDPATKTFFAGSDFRKLLQSLSETPLPEAAEKRLAKLREGYFDYFLERRTNDRQVPATDDFALCKQATDYFIACSRRIADDAIPVGSSLAGTLLKPAVSIGPGISLDVLTVYALLRDERDFRVKGNASLGEICWWYLTAFVPANHVPPECISPAILAYANEVVSADEFSGLAVTRFIDLVCANSTYYGKRFDRKNPVDRLFLAMQLMATLFAQNPQLHALLRGILGFDETRSDVPVPLILVALSNEEHAAAATPRAPAARPAEKTLREVLVVGHATKNTGLGRNYRMLLAGLRADNAAVTGLDFDMDSAEFTAEIKRWRSACASRPVVVFAVNAQDVPEIYANDASRMLTDCHSAGFFLWETSQVPQVQRLGVELVDEVWSPTQYVADIYATAGAKAHVIGKGLYGEGKSTAVSQKSQPEVPTFVCVFDFDSSIERKNPLAVAQAFEQAFASQEDVRLIIKASTVNPQHWSNALGQWEKLAAIAARDRRIEFVTERYSDAQLAELIGQASCLVSLHRSEGFGYVIADAMAYGTPVITTGYSGNADFCTAETCLPVAYRLVDVDPKAVNWPTQGAQWAEPDVSSAAVQMRRVFDDYPAALALAQRAQKNIFETYSVERFRATLKARIAALAT